ncbi:alpha/beta hydrolase [Litoribacter ruber]|uniref:Alpha/beta hydrolase n=1 Tax=Litoribacter ruber TaxID=702568 RepID=A0AAP2CIH1_9BACT|nr:MULTISPECIES: alpha/beta hydrolase [Litoribacter]MBS9523886.1 alpha/beta hydrolase [Litoribacter alkaliphilus]MBT0811521.1 alpha/beta hydrolase [Litoribacter ruber]
MTDVLKRNNVKRFGQGQQAIVFSHGYGCDQNMWRFVAPAFENDYQVVLFDHVGSGQSDQSQYDYQKYGSLEGYAEDVIDLLEELQLKEVIFVAHSVSSMIGALAAAERPDLFEKLIMIGPSPCYINDEAYFGGFSKSDIDELVQTLENNYMGWSSFITPVIVGNPEQPQLSEELNSSFCSMDPDIAKHFARVTFLGDNREDLKNVLVPTLVVQTHPDAIAPLEVGRYVEKNLPKGELIQLDASGHCPHLTAPELTIEAIKNYLG